MIRPSVSIIVPVYNAEKTLRRCLDSIRAGVDEIIIADTGSSDSTKEIAAHYTDKIYDFAWIDDFSAARNFSFSKATMEFAMWLDADDVLLPEEYLAPRPQLDVCQPPCGPCLVDDRQRTRNLLGELLAGNQISHYHTPPPVPSHQCPAREQCGQPFSDLRHDLKLHC